ncbi:MAG: alanine--tRNA ligase-related protein [Hyphomonadaceae bacterium]
MKTRLLYLENPSILTWRSEVLEIIFTEPSRVSIVLNETPFFPKGGGQPGDVGQIEGPDFKMRVEQVALDAGEVVHRGIVNAGEVPAIGTTVWASVDHEHRWLTSRTHTGGEIICAAVHELGKRWVVSAAGHVPGQSRVAFLAPDLSEADTTAFAQKLEGAIAAIIERDDDVRTYLNVPHAEVRRLCPLESLDHLPNGTPIRLVSPVPNFYRPCSGAHVAHTGQVGRVVFRRVRLRKGELSITYDVEHTEKSRQADDATVGCV